MNYVITADAKISVLADRKPAKGEEVFSDAKSLREAARAALGKGVSLSQFLVDAYNSIPGVAKVKRFENTDTALARILKATVGIPVPGKAKKEAKAPTAAKPEAKAKPAKKAAAAVVGGAPREGSKKEMIIELLKKGATRERIQEVTGWQAHSVRGFLCTLGKTTIIKRSADGVYALGDAK